MALSKKLRFEVFKRDKFTCQYCGKAAPDVVLHCDHIEPKSKGGSNTILNLITSCIDCNLGKGARRLSDDSVITKQRDQLALLQERKEQIGMMMDWQRSLLSSDNHAVDELEAFWCDLADWHGLTEDARKELRKHLRRFGMEEVLTAMRIASESYFDYDENGKLTDESTSKGFDKIGGICGVRKSDREHPEYKDLFYIRGILKNRLSYVKLEEAKQLLISALQLGGTIQEMKRIALTETTWRGWEGTMCEYIDVLGKEDGE